MKLYFVNYQEKNTVCSLHHCAIKAHWKLPKCTGISPALLNTVFFDP